MPNTIKSVCDTVKDKLCKVPLQDFAAAAAIRDIQRMVDPEGIKKLNPNQVKTTKAFLKILAKTAHQ